MHRVGCASCWSYAATAVLGLLLDMLPPPGRGRVATGVVDWHGPDRYARSVPNVPLLRHSPVSNRFGASVSRASTLGPGSATGAARNLRVQPG